MFTSNDSKIFDLKELHRKRVLHLEEKIAELEAEVQRLNEELKEKDDEIELMSWDLAGRIFDVY